MVISNAFKNIGRHYRKSVLYTAICIIAVLVLQTYTAGIDRIEQQLRSLSGTIPISAQVASRDGLRFNGLQIRE